MTGFSGSSGSEQNGQREVHSLDMCGICTDAQYLLYWEGKVILWMSKYTVRSTGVHSLNAVSHGN